MTGQPEQAAAHPATLAELAAARARHITRDLLPRTTTDFILLLCLRLGAFARFATRRASPAVTRSALVDLAVTVLAQLDAHHTTAPEAPDSMTRDTTETARLTADVVALADHDGQWHVLLIQRDRPPHQGRWALPGGHVEQEEPVERAACRELLEETGLQVELTQLDPVGVYNAPGRDPRGRTVSFAYLTVLDHLAAPTAGDDARAARWHPVPAVLADASGLAFDHHQILTDALKRLHATPEPEAS